MDERGLPEHSGATARSTGAEATLGEANRLFSVEDHAAAAAAYEAYLLEYGNGDGSPYERECAAMAMFNMAASLWYLQRRWDARAAYGVMLAAFEPHESDYIDGILEVAAERYARSGPMKA